MKVLIILSLSENNFMFKNMFIQITNNRNETTTYVHGHFSGLLATLQYWVSTAGFGFIHRKFWVQLFLWDSLRFSVVVWSAQGLILTLGSKYFHFLVNRILTSGFGYGSWTIKANRATHPPVYLYVKHTLNYVAFWPNPHPSSEQGFIYNQQRDVSWETLTLLQCLPGTGVYKTW